MMNLPSISPQQSVRESTTSENDLEKLMNICNSYGLNQEETSQLISEFKRGALFRSNQSFNDSLNDMTFSIKHQEEQYSFKHNKEGSRKQGQSFAKKEWIYMSQSQEFTNRNETDTPLEGLEKLLQQKFRIEKDLVDNLQQENIKLKTVLEEKEIKIDELLDMKRQDTEIIGGLKDIISNLTLALQQKENSYQQIQSKYTTLMESKVKEKSEMKLSTETEDYDALTDISNKQSRINNEGLEEKSSGKESEGNLRKSKASRIDIKKYKEMIENIRNNY